MLDWTRHTHGVNVHVPTHHVLSRTGYTWYVNLHEANIPFITIGMVTWMCCTPHRIWEKGSYCAFYGFHVCCTMQYYVTSAPCCRLFYITKYYHCWDLHPQSPVVSGWLFQENGVQTLTSGWFHCIPYTLHSTYKVWLATSNESSFVILLVAQRVCEAGEVSFIFCIQG